MVNRLQLILSQGLSSDLNLPSVKPWCEHVINRCDVGGPQQQQQERGHTTRTVGQTPVHVYDMSLEPMQQRDRQTEKSQNTISPPLYGNDVSAGDVVGISWQQKQHFANI